ncbi:MAG: hypothetical protein ABWW69_01415 [Pyrodictiaceae archaeon]
MSINLVSYAVAKRLKTAKLMMNYSRYEHTAMKLTYPSEIRIMV